jgi:hypothetical protein
VTFTPKLTPAQSVAENELFKEQKKMKLKYPDNPSVKPTACYCMIIYKTWSQGFQGKYDQSDKIIDAFRCPIHEDIPLRNMYEVTAKAQSKKVIDEIQTFKPEEQEDEAIRRFDVIWNEILAEKAARKKSK